VKRRLPLGLPYGATLLGLLFVGMLPVAFVGLFVDPGMSWAPWEPFRAWLAVVATVAVLTWPRRAAVLAVLAWALVAAPLVPGVSSRGLAPNVPGKVVGTPSPGERVPSGTYAVRAGAVPIGATRLNLASRVYLNGEGGYPMHDLVAWSLVLLPWPHVDRTTIALVGGTNQYWNGPVTVAREGHTLLISATREFGPEALGAPVEVKELGWGLSGSGVTYVGWLLVALALLVRLLRARMADTRRTPMAPS